MAATKASKKTPGAARASASKKAPTRGRAAAKTKPPARTASKPKAGVVLLSGGNPQIAKADGAAPVKAYLDALPDWKRAVGQRLDALIVRAVPGVQKAVRWNSPMYGIADRGYFASLHAFNKFMRVTYFYGQQLRPVPPGPSKDPNARYLDVREDDALDEAQFVAWAKQAASKPGWDPGASMRKAAKVPDTKPTKPAKTAKTTAVADTASASAQIEQRIRDLDDWRGETLARMRTLIRQAAPAVVEEIKWRGTPVWSHDGIVCTGETYAKVVKLTFAHGASLPDPTGLFNASLDGGTRRAIDLREGDAIDAAAFKALIKAALADNAARVRARKKR